MAREHPFLRGRSVWPMASERAAAMEDLSCCREHRDSFYSREQATCSAGGLYVRLRRRVEPGVKLFAVVRLATATDSAAPAPCVAVRGVVRRAEPQPDGTYGVRVACTHHRFL